MPVKIAVLRETRPDERRVAMVPVVADKLIKLGAEIHMQTGAGDAVKLPDQAFRNVAFAQVAYVTRGLPTSGATASRAAPKRSQCGLVFPDPNVSHMIAQ